MEEPHKGDGIARAMLQPINTAATIILAIFTLVWGVWIGNPFWSLFDTSSVYNTMAFLPEYFWGGVAALCGAGMIWGVLRNSYNSLKMSSVIGFYHWIAITVLFFLGDWRGTGGITALLIASYCGFIYLNLRVNKRILHFGRS
jgi:hypothetical protein